MVAKSAINLNLTDYGNYPAANMRFFELPIMRGFQLVARSPEMASGIQGPDVDGLREGTHMAVYDDIGDIPGLIEKHLNDPEGRQKMIEAAHDTVKSHHTYAHRAQTILSSVGLSPGA